MAPQSGIQDPAGNIDVSFGVPVEEGVAPGDAEGRRNDTYRGEKQEDTCEFRKT